MFLIILIILCQRYFIVGSNNARTKFRILKIDRTEGQDLTVVDDRVEYTEPDMRNTLNLGLHRSSGLGKIASAFGIVGKEKTFLFVTSIIIFIIWVFNFETIFHVKVLFDFSRDII